MRIRTLLSIFLLFSPHTSYATCNYTASSQGEIDEQIIEEIQKKNKGAIDIKLTSNHEISNKFDLCISSIALDEYGNTFRVNFKIDGKNYLYQGKFTFNYLIPALQTNMKSGEIIKHDDIYFISYPATRINNNIIQNKEDLIGKAVRNNIQSDKPINIREIYNPILIHKNETVNVVYEKVSNFRCVV